MDYESAVPSPMMLADNTATDDRSSTTGDTAPMDDATGISASIDDAVGDNTSMDASAGDDAVADSILMDATSCDKSPMDATASCDKSPMDAAAASDKSPMDAATADDNALMDAATCDKSPIDVAAVCDKSPMDAAGYDKSPMDAATPDDNTPMDAAASDNALMDDAPVGNASKDNTARDNVPEGNTPGDNEPEDNTAGDNAQKDNTAGDNAPVDSTQADNFPGDGASRESASENNSQKVEVTENTASNDNVASGSSEQELTSDFEVFGSVTNDSEYPKISPVPPYADKEHDPEADAFYSTWYKHPAPLPREPKYKKLNNCKMKPPRPGTKATKHASGGCVHIRLSWYIDLTPEHADIWYFQVFAYQEKSNVVHPRLWRKVSSVPFLQAAMGCTLSGFVDGFRYHFAVRAVDVHKRIGPFGNVVSVRYRTPKKEEEEAGPSQESTEAT